MLKIFKDKISKLDIHTTEVFKKTSTSMIIKVLGILSRLLVSIFLGRTLGKEGLGDINIINQIVTIVMIFSMLGIDNVLIKQVSIGFSRNNNKLIGSSIRTSLLINGFVSLFIASVGVLFSNAIANIFNSPQLQFPLIIAFSVILPQTIGRVLNSGINGYRKIWQSNLFKETLTSVIVLIGLLLFLAFNINITIVSVILLYAIGRVITFLSASIYWKFLFKASEKREFLGRSMLKMATPLLLVSVTTIIAASADVLMLGWLTNSSEVGLYTVASRLALFIIFFLQVSNSAISPKIASLYVDKKIGEMNIMVKRVTLGLIIIGVVFLIFFILFGKDILGLWGSDFIEAYMVLIILGIGQMVNISTGCSGLLLIMCGFEKTHGYISVIFVSINLVLNYFLILRYGAIGAATATSLTVIFENIFKVYYAKKLTGVLTLPFKI